MLNSKRNQSEQKSEQFLVSKLSKFEGLTIEQLPVEIILFILSFLACQELATAQLINKFFNQLALDSLLWKNLFFSAAPGFKRILNIKPEAELKKIAGSINLSEIDYPQMVARYYRLSLSLKKNKEQYRIEHPCDTLVLEADFEVFRKMATAYLDGLVKYEELLGNELSEFPNSLSWAGKLAAFDIDDPRDQKKLNYLYHKLNKKLAQNRWHITNTSLAVALRESIITKVLFNQSLEGLPPFKPDRVNDSESDDFFSDATLEQAFRLAIVLGNIEQIKDLIQLGAAYLSYLAQAKTDHAHFGLNQQNALLNPLILALHAYQAHVFIFLLDQYREKFACTQIPQLITRISEYFYGKKNFHIVEYLLALEIDIDFKKLMNSDFHSVVHTMAKAKEKNLKLLERKTKNIVMQQCAQKNTQQFFELGAQSLNILCGLNLRIDFAKGLAQYRKNGDFKILDMIGVAVRENYFSLMENILAITTRGINATLSKGTGSNSSCMPRYYWLHQVVRYNHVRMVELLLQYGANVSLRDLDSKIPLDYAFELGHLEIIKMLLLMHAKELVGSRKTKKIKASEQTAQSEIMVLKLFSYAMTHPNYSINFESFFKQAIDLRQADVAAYLAGLASSCADVEGVKLKFSVQADFELLSDVIKKDDQDFFCFLVESQAIILDQALYTYLLMATADFSHFKILKVLLTKFAKHKNINLPLKLLHPDEENKQACFKLDTLLRKLNETLSEAELYDHLRIIEFALKEGILGSDADWSLMFKHDAAVPHSSQAIITAKILSLLHCYSKDESDFTQWLKKLKNSLNSVDTAHVSTGEVGFFRNPRALVANPIGSAIFRPRSMGNKGA